MHYLEDYIEIVQVLPAELRKKLIQLARIDGTVEKNFQLLEDKAKTFFTLARKSKPDWKKDQYDNLSVEYEKALKEAEDRTKGASEVKDLLDKHLRRLDMDLQKFKFELEADSAGITETLEQKSYTLDRPPTPEKPITTGRKKYSMMEIDPLGGGGDYDPDDYFSPMLSAYDGTQARRRKSRAGLAASLFLNDDNDTLDSEDPMLISPTKLYSGTGGKPPLVTTPFYDPKTSRKRGLGHRSSSLFDDEFSLGTTSGLGELGLGEIDPDEERYCLCNQVSFGEMVACDNQDCEIEWFHYGCVNITEPPKGKWYCPRCVESFGPKKKRKN